MQRSKALNSLRDPLIHVLAVRHVHFGQQKPGMVSERLARFFEGSFLDVGNGDGASSAVYDLGRCKSNARRPSCQGYGAASEVVVAAHNYIVSGGFSYAEESLPNTGL